MPRMPWNGHIQTAGVYQTARHWHKGPMLWTGMTPQCGTSVVAAAWPYGRTRAPLNDDAHCLVAELLYHNSGNLASALNLAFAKPIARCLTTMNWAVNTRLSTASDIESTSLLCWRNGRCETLMSDIFTSLLTLQLWAWKNQAHAGHSCHLNYLFTPPPLPLFILSRVVILAYFSWNLVQLSLTFLVRPTLHQGKTTQH